MMHTFATALVVSVGFTAHAAGQDQSSSEPAGNFLTEPGPQMLMSSGIGAILVYGPDGEQVGDVEDIVLTFDGSIAAVLVGVGGTLGLAEKPVAVAMEHVTISKGEEKNSYRVDLDLDRAALDAAPKFKPPEG